MTALHFVLLLIVSTAVLLYLWRVNHLSLLVYYY